MNLSKRFSLALAALVLVVLTGAGSAFAQSIPFNVLTAPTDVANTGMSEVMGQVTMNVDITCAFTPCNAPAGSIKVLYVGTPIDNAIATGVTIGTINTNGIEVCETPPAGVTVCNAAGTYLNGSFAVTNTAGGGVVSFGVNAILVGAPMPTGFQVIVRGVRGQIASGPGNVVGSSILGQLTTSPSTIAGFQPTSEVVARSADPLTVAFKAWTVLECLPKAGSGSVTITEGFNTAFVDQGAANPGVDPFDTVATLNIRPLFGPSSVDSLSATPTLRQLRNSRINIVLTGLPTGVKIAWPLTSDVDSGGGLVGSKLLIVVQSVSGDQATYTFASPNQGASDINGEKFVIKLTALLNVTLSGTASDFGTSTGQAQMYDPSAGTATTTVAGSQPRYNHPLEPVPGATFLTVAPCTTNLLFPWVLNFANADTGIAISNTSADPYGTIPQTGTCTVNLFPTDKTTNNGVSAGAAVSVTTAAIQPGSVWRTSLSGNPTFAGLAGYVIAVCRFQYGHGFAFITDNFPNSPVSAQGYVALIIPDPVLLKSRSAAVSADDLNPVIAAPPYGEGLAQ